MSVPSSAVPMRKQMEDYIVDLQNRIVGAFEQLDPASPPFRRDAWTRPEGGRGESSVFAQSPEAAAAAPAVLEKGGVNISIVHGMLPPAAIKQMRADHTSIPFDESNPKSFSFFAAGLSLVIHPRNPHAPTVHANYRYFEITADPTSSNDPPAVLAWWFGGGADLTPSYLYEEDAVHFHRTIAAACAPHGAVLYPAFKKWCDKYFFIQHRNESRGIGGLFFDDFSADPHPQIPGDVGGSVVRPRTPEEIFAFVRSAGDSFVPSYIPILARRCRTPYTEEERRWQLLRRGRYVEFNLIYDRGTKFGLMTPGARVESILMSLPEVARWEYMSEVGTEATSREGRLQAALKTPRDWAA